MKSTLETTVKVYLETLYPGKDEKFPLKLQLIHERTVKRYVLKYPDLDEPGFRELYGQTIRLSVDAYNSAMGTKPRKEFKILRKVIDGCKARAIVAVKKTQPFTIERFEELYFGKPKDDQDLFAAIQAKVDGLKAAEKFNTATTYENTLTSLKGFTKKESYPFRNVTPKLLNDWERWMLSREIGKKKKHLISPTTVSIYGRCLRSIFREYAPEGTLIPFGGKQGYTIPYWRESKRALSFDDITKLAKAELIPGSMEEKARDYWLFSYLTNGINLSDMFRLKYSNIVEGEYIEFTRMKTSRKGKEPVKIQVVITKPIARIIDKHGVKGGPDRYIFNVLLPGMSVQRQLDAIKQEIKNVNKYVRRVCNELEIPPVTSYAARHSFATVLKRSGVSTEFISESLGHRSLATTQNYLASFELKAKKDIQNKLLPDFEEQQDNNDTQS